MKQVVIFADERNKFLDRLSKWWRWLRRGYKKRKAKRKFFSKLSKHCEIEKVVLYCRDTQTLWVKRKKQEEHVLDILNDSRFKRS
jgi:hypothetical protein